MVKREVRGAAGHVTQPARLTTHDTHSRTHARARALSLRYTALLTRPHRDHDTKVAPPCTALQSRPARQTLGSRELNSPTCNPRRAAIAARSRGLRSRAIPPRSDVTRRSRASSKRMRPQRHMHLNALVAALVARRKPNARRYRDGLGRLGVQTDTTKKRTAKDVPKNEKKKTTTHLR